mmetsp:Transcript_92204/g.166522  ORF Transcript_92204/g.166522 Transcript_92204/m.166522 type:complete len:209 (+) Transcript_92204:692-1318(+)
MLSIMGLPNTSWSSSCSLPASCCDSPRSLWKSSSKASQPSAPRRALATTRFCSSARGSRLSTARPPPQEEKTSKGERSPSKGRDVTSTRCRFLTSRQIKASTARQRLALSSRPSKRNTTRDILMAWRIMPQRRLPSPKVTLRYFSNQSCTAAGRERFGNLLSERLTRSATGSSSGMRLLCLSRTSRSRRQARHDFPLPGGPWMRKAFC